MLKLTNPSPSYPVEDKRFYVPGAKLEGECPACKAPYVHHFGKHPFSYPAANGPNKVHCYCDKCEHEWEVQVRLNVSLELIPSHADGLARGPFKLFGMMKPQDFETLAEAAQEAEFLHSQTGSAVQVQDADGSFVYTSKGAPD